MKVKRSEKRAYFSCPNSKNSERTFKGQGAEYLHREESDLSVLQVEFCSEAACSGCGSAWKGSLKQLKRVWLRVWAKSGEASEGVMQVVPCLAFNALSSYLSLHLSTRPPAPLPLNFHTFRHPIVPMSTLLPVLFMLLSLLQPFKRAQSSV